jgi:chromosome segregation ATPase
MTVQQKTLDEQLDDLRRELITSQGNLQQAQIDIKAQEDGIKLIGSLINEFDQIVDDYRKSYPELMAKYEEYDAFYNNEKKCLENILTQPAFEYGDTSKKTGVDKVTCIVGKEREDINKLKQDIETKTANLEGGPDKNAKRQQLVCKQKSLEKAKKVYELWKDPVKSVKSRFSELDKFKKEIDKEHAAANYPFAFYLLKYKFRKILQSDLNQVLDDDASDNGKQNKLPLVVEPGNLGGALQGAWRRYRDAVDELNQSEGQVKKLEKELETLKGQFAEDQKNLESTLQRRLTNLVAETCLESTDSQSGTENC